MAAEVMREVNPGKIMAEVMGSMGEAMQDWGDEFPGKGRHQAEEEQTLEFSGVKRLDLTNLRGDVEINGRESPEGGLRVVAKKTTWGRDEEEARERLKNIQVFSSQEGDFLKLKVEGGPWTRKLHAEVDFEIQAPAACGLAVSIAKGDLSVKGITGQIGLKTVSGDIEMHECGGNAEVSTASGDIAIEKFDGEALAAGTINGDIEAETLTCQATFNSVSGDIQAKGIAGGALTANSVSGTIELEDFEVPSVTLQTQSGDVEMEHGVCPDVRSSSVSGDVQAELTTREGNITIRSTSGDVDLRLGRDTDAQVDCETMSGDIDVDLPIQKTLASERKYQGTLGNGRGRIRVGTTSGDISIH
jgi:DUF4097 and DUF4098 domain-containing protein YvlB